MSSKLFLLIFVLFLSVCNGARILGIVPTPSYSHQVVFRPIWKEFAARGHEIVVLTPMPMNKNITGLQEIDMSSTIKIWTGTKGIEKVVNDYSWQGFLSTLFVCSFTEMFTELLNQQLALTEVKELIDNTTQKFDLVILEYPNALALSIFAKRFNCPLIGISSYDAPMSVYAGFGNPHNVILNPETFLPYVGDLSYIDRIWVLHHYLQINLIVYFHVRHSHNALVKIHFGKNYPPAEEVAYNADLLFVNHNPILFPVRPVIPTIIQLGGLMHIQSPKPLEKELQTVLDEAEDGFIYFSLGSNMKSSSLSTELIEKLISIFSGMPYKVIWKFEESERVIWPDNIYTAKWFPQQDVLRHKNIKLFVSQGGLQSVEEAIYYEVPLVGIPAAVDQIHNMKLMKLKGAAEVIPLNTIVSLDTKIIQDTFKMVINEERYLLKIKKLKRLLQDQPMSPLEKVVWWTEYVLRNNGTQHLRNPAMDIPFYKLYCLDIILPMALVICTIMGVLMHKEIIKWYYPIYFFIFSVFGYVAIVLGAYIPNCITCIMSYYDAFSNITTANKKH